MKKIMNYFKKEDGFTLLEMSIVILVITALMLIVIMNVDGVSSTVDNKTGGAMVKTVETQMVLYEINEDEKLSGTNEVKVATLLSADYISEEQSEAYLNYLANRNNEDDG